MGSPPFFIRFLSESLLGSDELLTFAVQSRCSRLRAENERMTFPQELIKGTVPMSTGSYEKVPEDFIRPHW